MIWSRSNIIAMIVIMLIILSSSIYVVHIVKKHIIIADNICSLKYGFNYTITTVSDYNLCGCKWYIYNCPDTGCDFCGNKTDSQLMTWRLK